MSETAELAAALAAAQAELPEIKKTRNADVKNKEGKYLYSYSYADLADVSAAVLPVLGRHGLAFTAFPSHQPDGKFGLRYYLLHSSGASLEGFFEIDDKGGMQLVGGRITYARRYCLCAVAGVTADEDVDAREDGGHSRTARRQQQPRDGGDRAPQQAVQRQRQAPRPAARDDLPPLPGEDEQDPTTSGASSSARAPAQSSPQASGGPSPSSPDGSGSEPATNKQLTAIWTALTRDFAFSDDEKEQARMACGLISGRGSQLASTKDLTKRDAGTVIDTLAHLKAQGEAEGEEPRSLLIALLAQREDGEARDGE